LLNKLFRCNNEARKRGEISKKALGCIDLGDAAWKKKTLEMKWRTAFKYFREQPAASFRL